MKVVGVGGKIYFVRPHPPPLEKASSAAAKLCRILWGPIRVRVGGASPWAYNTGKPHVREKTFKTGHPDELAKKQRD